MAEDRSGASRLEPTPPTPPTPRPATVGVDQGSVVDAQKERYGVWLWAVLIAIVLAIVGAVAGSKYNVLGQLNAFPRIPVNEGTLSSAGIIALLAVAVAALVGAILGGLAGMRYHRKVDQAGVEAAHRLTNG